MKEKSIRHAEREKIESVIYSFYTRFWDIKTVMDRPHAAATLSAQLLDQLSGVLYKGEPRDRVDQFVRVYLPNYRDQGIYDLFREALEYNYSIERVATDSKETTIVKPLEAKGKRLFPQFWYDLKEGVEKAFEELRREEEKRNRALEWYETHKVREIPQPLYTDEEQWKIVDYYTPRIKSQRVFDGGSYNIGLNFSPFADNGYRINVCVDDQESGKEVTRIPLDLLAGLLRLKKIEEVVQEGVR